MFIIMSNKLPIICPSCTNTLSVAELCCDNCHTAIKGKYVIPEFLKLSAEEQDFLLNFVKESGSLKNMSQRLGLSYPTVRNMLDDMIAKL